MKLKTKGVRTSVGQRTRLITEVSGVQVPPDPPKPKSERYTMNRAEAQKKWVEGKLLRHESWPSETLSRRRPDGTAELFWKGEWTTDEYPALFVGFRVYVDDDIYADNWETNDE